MYEWEMVSNKVKRVCLSKNRTFDEIKNDCNNIIRYLRKELERKKKVFSSSFANEDPTPESKSASSINDFDLGPSFNNFKEYESIYIVNYMFSFCRSFMIVKKKLNLILEILSSLNPLFISEVQDDLIRLLKLFDSNEEDTVNNLVKKVKEMNVFLYEEYKKYSIKCRTEVNRVKELTKKILPIGQNVSTNN